MCHWIINRKKEMEILYCNFWAFLVCELNAEGRVKNIYREKIMIFLARKKSCNIYLFCFFPSRRSNARRKQVSQTENGIIPRSPNNGMYEPKLFIASTIKTQINLALLLSLDRLGFNGSTENSGNFAKVTCIWAWQKKNN